MLKERLFRRFLALSFVFALICLTFTFVSTIQAQDYWTALPPYNTLWPLWSPALSPFDAVTGIPTPIVSSLASSTVLPVQPGLTWNPSLEYPWLLYNTPVGLAYFDPLYGVNSWPPSSLLDSAGAPLPITLPDLYGSLPPTSSLWLQQNVLFANSYFLQAYPSLLLAADSAALLAAAPTLLPPAIFGALTLGLPLPVTTLTAIFPPPGLTTLLTPAGLLGL